MTTELIDKVKAGNSPAAQYIGKYAQLRGSYNYLWDELTSAAWLDPSLITKKENRYMDVNLDRGAGYGDTLTWTDKDNRIAKSDPWKCNSISTRRNSTRCLWSC